MPQLTGSFLLYALVLVTVFWRVRESWRPLVLAAGGATFLVLWDPVSFAVLLTLGSAVYWLARRSARRGFGIVLIGLVAFFLVVKAGSALGRAEVLGDFVVPLGFGFYLLRLLHYWIDSEVEGLEPHSYLSFFNYSFFFPTILVGPIHRIQPFLRDERRRRWDPDLFAAGLERILYGYAKVVVLANWAVDYLLRESWGEVVAADTAGDVLRQCCTYGLYLYFAFAGYSDIAIGLARLFGHTVTENFDRPFVRRNIAEFWRSWHMSLSDWCRRYIFTPVLARWRQPTWAVLATMLTIGLWHELTVRYVLWGLYHGLGLAIHRRFEAWIGARTPEVTNPVAKTLGKGIATATTFSFVMIGFIITRNPSLEETVDDFRILLTGWWR